MKKALMVAVAATLAVSLFAYDHGFREDNRRRSEHGRRSRHGVIIPAENIPQAAQDFIAEYFPDATVLSAASDSRMFKVALSDGTEIAFTPDGEWHNVRSYAGVPVSVLPQEAANSARELYPDISIMIAERYLRRGLGIKLMLANSMEMYFDNSGKLLGQRFHGMHN